VIDQVPGLSAAAAYAKQATCDRLVGHARYIIQHGIDMPDVKDWRWRG
jgi:xylulose-5-phosphate/fructose-6-phosphate phosphoketolase